MDEIEVLYKALELCNESRNRLTRFQFATEHWLDEAEYALSQIAAENADNIKKSID